MILMTEAESSALVTHELAFAAARDAFIAAVTPDAAVHDQIGGGR